MNLIKRVNLFWGKDPYILQESSEKILISEK